MAKRSNATANQLSIARGELSAAQSQASALGQDASALRSQVETLLAQNAALRASKVRTIVKTRTITKNVPTWIPDGTAVTVELTGFEGQIVIHDVQLTHGFGFSDLVGIAVNESGRTIPYAELGCTFVDADGVVLANSIDNRSDWAVDASWGFDCAAQVDATGGTLRVDELS